MDWLLWSGAGLQGGDVMEKGINNIWDFLTWLWTSAVDFLNTEISGFGLDFTLWEWALGSAILYLVLYAIFRALQ